MSRRNDIAALKAALAALDAERARAVRVEAELAVALAKASPGKYTYATTGVDGPNYLAFQLFLQRAGINMLHVPYKGDGQSVVALAAGEVDIFVGGLQSALPLMKAGRVKALADAAREAGLQF